MREGVVRAWGQAKNRSLTILGCVVAVALLCLLVFLVDRWLGLPVDGQSEKRLDKEIEVFKTVAQFLGGGALLFGLYLTWRRITATERNVEIAQEGQITERFTRAIEQLGAVHEKTGEPNLEVRLGGIYALERIAKDSKNDHWTVMEVLTAYVRENSPWDYQGDEPGERLSAIRREPLDHRQRTAVQAILTVVGRRVCGDHEKGQVLNLQETNLHSTDLSAANLKGVNLWGANLKETNLSEANLEGTNLASSNLTGAVFRYANLTGVDLGVVDLDTTDLLSANLSGAQLLGARGLTEEQIQEAIVDDETKLPDYLQTGEGEGDDQPEQENDEGP